MIESKTFATFVFWVLANTFLLRFIFTHGFENDPGILAPLLIILLMLQCIILASPKLSDKNDR